MPKQKHKRVVEWDLLVVFVCVAGAWMLLGLPVLNSIALEYSSLVAYLLFIGVFGLIGFLAGNRVHKGRESLAVTVSMVLLTDLITPPIVLSHDTIPSSETLSIWGSDTAIYNLWSMTGWEHQILWVLTYIITPTLCFLTLLYFLSGKTLTNKITIILNGK